MKSTLVDSIKRYDVKQWALWLCILLCALSLAILPLSHSYISHKTPINLIYAALVIFLCAFWRDVSRLRQIKFVLLCMAVIVLMAYCSLFYAENISQTKQMIRQYLLESTLFMCFSFLLSLRLSPKQNLGLFIALCVAFFYHPLATIYDFYANGNGVLGYRAKLPNYYIPATAYSFYLLFAFSLAYIAFLKTSRILKILCGIFTLLAICAFVCNGGRFGILSLIAMLCSPFIFFTYQYKKSILLGLVFTLCAGIIALYYASTSWQDRYNFHKILNHFTEVWQSAPAEMGKFIGTGCKTWVVCSQHSLDKQSDIILEYSTVDRISKLKSTLLAIADNPLRPNGYHFQQFPFNIQHIFPLDSVNHPFSLEPYKDTFIARHAHNHNYPSSIFFELGLVGFVAFSLFTGYFIYALYKAKITFSANSNIWHIFIGGIGFGIIGLIVANFFDGFPVREGQLVLFVLYGYFLAYFRILEAENAH